MHPADGLKIAADRVGHGVDKGLVVGVDIQDMEPAAGLMKIDFLDDSA